MARITPGAIISEGYLCNATERRAQCSGNIIYNLISIILDFNI